MKLLAEIATDVVIFFAAAVIASGAFSSGKAGTCGKTKPAPVEKTSRPSP